MKLLAVEEQSMAISKPPILALFMNVGSEGSRSINWKVDAVFHPNEQLVDVLTCAKVMADDPWGSEHSERVRSASGPYARGVASTGRSGVS